MFFHLRPKVAVLSDVNARLVETFRAVRDNPAAVQMHLGSHVVSQEYYNNLRRSPPSPRNQLAAWFLYLNRTAFSGLYRENKKGEFTIPYGGGARTPARLLANDVLRDSSTALKTASLRTCDFGEVLRRAGPGDVVYCDPPYTAMHNNNGFRRYNNQLFSWADQERLAAAVFTAAARGAYVFISNADHGSISALYEGQGALIERRCRRSAVSASVSHRGVVSELLITVIPKS